MPIVALEARVDAAGGAANTALNLARLGARVRLLSVVGSDGEGERLRVSLRGAGVDDTLSLARRLYQDHRVLVAPGEQVRMRTASFS